MSMILITTTGDPALDILVNAGGPGILALSVIAFLRGWVVTGKTLERVLSERDRALDLVYKQAAVAQLALEAGEKAKKDA